MNFLLRASRAILLTVALMSFAVSVAPVHAAPGVRANVTYQARLMDASGYPVADGVYQVEFSLYDAPVAGTRLWTADGTVGAPLPVNVTVQDGLFTVLLGDGVTQLPFGDINWNSDSLYLGVTIGADGEMSPRRPITAVPQAINSAQLGGMSPSSTDTYGGESQFTILQASTTAATSTRSALDVRSNGTSVANDFILRALTNTGSPAFTITSQGVVSTTNLLVTGQNVCLADGTNCIAGSEADTLATVTARGPTTTVPLTFFGGATTSLLNVTSTASLIGNVTLGDAGSDLITVGGRFASSLVPTSPTGLSLGNSTNRWDGYFENTTATIFAATFVSSSQLVVAGQQVCLANGNNCLSATTSLQMAYDNGRFITLDDGRIQFEGVTGAQDEFNFNGLTATPILGAGYAGATNTGFDLSLAFNGTSGTFFSFTDNRNDPSATVNTSYLVHIPGNDNTLLLGNATSFIQFDNDIVDITNGSNEIFLDQGQQFFTADSDITGDTPFYFQDIGSQSSLLGLSNSNGLNLIHLGSDINPNGAYTPEASGDLLIRSASTGGSGTQLYVNVDGTDTGWRGVATTDMLAGSENLVSKLSENLTLGDSISFIDVEGRMAFVIYSSGEWGIIDVTEPGQMVETYHQFGSAVHGQLVGKRLYVVDSNGFVEAYDVSDPTNASFLGDLTLPDPSYANNAHIVVEGSTIYFASDNYFVTIDARDPATMAVFADSGMPPGLFEYTNLIAQDGILYFSYKQIGNPDTEMAIFDVNDPVIFDSIGSGLFTSESQDDAQMAISDNRFYIKRHNGAEQVIDVYRTTNGMVDFGGGPLTTLDPSGDAIDHFEVYRGRIYVAAFIEGSTQKLFETFTTNFDGTYSSEQLLTNAFQTSDATDSPAIFNIEGAFAYGYDFDGVDHFIGVVDLGGMTTRSLRATNGDFGQLTVANGFTVRGTANFTNGITVDGRGVCLSDGTNCVSTAGDAITSIGVEDTNFDNLFIDAEGGLMLLIDDTAGAWIYEVATREDGVTQLSGNGDAVTGKLVGDRLFLVDTDGSLAIRDLTDPNNPVLLGGPTPITGGEGLSFDSGAQIEIEGNIAYFTATNTLRTIDISDPANISVLDSVNFADGDVRYPHIAIMDGVLYFASKRPNDIDASTTLFEAYNVQDPSNILLLGDMTQSARDRNDTQIAIMDRKIYFIRNTGTGDRLRAHSVATGFFGASIITLTPPVDSIGHFEVYRGHVYLSGYDEGGLQHQFYSYAYDGFDYTLEQTITDEVGTYDDGSSPANFDIDGSYLYSDYGFGQTAFGYLSLSGTKSRALSASNGEFGQMVIGDELSVQGFANFANGITVDGRGVCLSDGTNCVGGAGFSLAPMTVTSTVGTGFGTIYEVEANGATLLVRNQLYDLSDPKNPAFVSTYASIPADVSIQGSKLYGIGTSIDGTSTLMSYDIRDRANPTLIADADLVDVSAGDMAYKIDGSLLYYADDDVVSVYDIRDLSAPVLLGTVALPSTYTAPSVDYSEGYLYYTARIDANDTVALFFDVRNPAAPTLLETVLMSGSNNVAYNPKVVVSDNRAYFMSRDADMVVKSFDISDRANPGFLYDIVPTYGEIHDFEVVGATLYISAHSVDNANRNFERWNVASNSVATLIDSILNQGNENFAIAGGYAYLADSPDIKIIDLGGMMASNVIGATGDFGQLAIGNGGLSVRGQSDFQNGITVNGVGVCLADGTDCPSGASSLQQAYDQGDTIVGTNLFLDLDTTFSTSTFYRLTSDNAEFNVEFLDINTELLDIIATNTSIFAVQDMDFIAQTGDISLDAQGALSDIFVTAGGDWVNDIDGEVQINSYTDRIYLYAQNGIEVNSSLFPVTNNLFNLGSTTSSFRNLYTSGTQYFVNATGARLDLMTSSTYSQLDVVTGEFASAVLVGDYVYSSAFGFNVTDVSDPYNLRVVGSVIPGISNGAIAVKGDYAFMAGGLLFATDNIWTLDISNPATPRVVATTTLAGTANFINVQTEGNMLYVGQERSPGSYIAIYDATNPLNPSLVTTTYLNAINLERFTVKDGFAYVGNASTFRIYDLRKPLQATMIGSVALTPGVNEMSVIKLQGNYAYVMRGDYFEIIDISNPTAPVIVYTRAFVFFPNNMFEIDGTTMYLDDGAISGVYDITSSTNPVLVGSMPRFTNISRYIPNGRSLLVSYGTSLFSYDTIGMKARSATIGTAAIGELQVGGSSIFNGKMDVFGGLTIGSSGLWSQGSIGSAATNTTSTFMGVVSSSRQTAGSLFVGLSNAHSQANFAAVISYASSASFGGLCVDDTGTGPTCPTAVGASIMADGAVQVSAFDLAELYTASGTVSAGDLVMFSQGATATVEVTQGMAYDPRAIGVISTRPGFVLGWEGDAQVALAGRVPVNVTVANGVIRVGDQLTSSEIAGTAMKSTRAGMIVGVALQDTDTDGVIEMFVQPEFSLSSSIEADGSIQFTNESGSTTFSVDTAGNGYFLGGVSATSFNTHAAFDLAEQYTSPDKLEAGDLVMISQKEDLQMIRTSEEGDQVIGIVSSAPGFTLGASATGSYPIALAGRVPTKVTNMNGDIERGDALSASSIPGVAQKATNAGQIIGYALQSYVGKDNGLIEVFVQPGYWMPKDGKEAAQKSASGLESGVLRQGFAKITSGGSRVSVKYTSILAYPVPQVTAMGNVSGGWWLEKVSDTGFEIVMDTIQPIDVSFAWQVSPAQTGIIEFSSDGTYGELDPLTGQRLLSPEPEKEVEPESVPEQESEPAPEVVIEVPSEDIP